MASSPDHLDPREHGWLHDKALRRILDTIKSGGGEARIVGGAVRDALLGRTPGEIDLAVNLPPEKTSDLLKKAGIKVVPTGIEHGTITAVADHRGFEITTLRRDVETFGRKAKVAFTDDWQADAARRDFTINALYADAGGKIYDYFSGREDLAAGRVRFIGDARARIKEDVLRILRFFRFYSWFGHSAPDEESLAACGELAGLIPQLSVERVWREIVKLLAAENPAPGWRLMQDSGVLAHVLPEADNIARLEGLRAAEIKYDLGASSLVRLAALLPSFETVADSVAQRLKLSNREGAVLRVLAVLPGRLKGKLDPVPFRRALYEYGIEPARDAALLLAAENLSVDLEPALVEAAAWEKPTFPLQGGDILKLGLVPGPKVGAILEAVEAWWIAQNFRPSRAECLAEAKKLAGETAD